MVLPLPPLGEATKIRFKTPPPNLRSDGYHRSAEIGESVGITGRSVISAYDMDQAKMKSLACTVVS